MRRRRQSKDRSGETLVRGCLTLSTVFSATALTLATLALVGWSTGGLSFLSQMHPLVSLGVASAALSTLLIREDKMSRHPSWLTTVTALVTTLLGLYGLGCYLFSWIPQITMPHATLKQFTAPASISFVFIGFALLIYQKRFLNALLAQLLTLIAGILAINTLNHSIFGITQLETLSFQDLTMGMDVFTASELLLLVLALLTSHPREGMMSLLTSGTRSGALARQILFVGTLTPPLVGLLTRLGLERGWYDVRTEISLFAVLMIALMLRTTWHAARRSEREELRAVAALAASRKSNTFLKKTLDEKQIFEALLKSSQDFIGISNADLNVIYINPAGRKMIGLPEEGPLPSAKVLDVYPTFHHSLIRSIIDRVRGSDQHVQVESCLRHLATGEIIPVSGDHFSIRETKTGRLIGFCTISRDIRERKRLEDELKIAVERASGIIAVSTDAIITTDEDRMITIFNGSAEKAFGYSKKEIIGQPFKILVPPRLHDHYEYHMKTFSQGSTLSFILTNHRDQTFGLRKNGEEFPIDVAISKFEVRGKKIITITIRDVTEQQKRESQLQFLAGAGWTLSESLDSEDIVFKTASLAVSEIADGCIVRLLSSENESRETLRVAAATHRNPKKKTSILIFGEKLQRASFLSDELKQAIATKRPVIIGDFKIPHSFLMETEDAGQDFIDYVLAVRSYVIIPLIIENKVIGTISLTADESNRRFHENDLSFFEAISRRFALSIENARLLRETRNAVKIREDVLAIVSHDLKTPLTTIALAEQILRDLDKFDSATLAEIADKIQISVNQMRRLISDLLDFAKIQSGTFAIETRPENLKDMITPLFKVFETQASAKKQRLTVNLPPSLPRVTCDSRRIEQLLSNILGNAVKFTPEGGHIDISGHQHGANIVISISDNGPGIPKEDLTRIFDRFWQSHSNKKNIGTGLGLSIAKGIARAHGGAIWVESELGRGSTFYFTLPMASSDVMPAEAEALSSKSGSNPLQDVRVLVVDDSLEMLDLMKRVLEKAGAQVAQADSVSEAMKQIKQKKPDVLLTDIEMPGEGGFDLIKKIHRLAPEDGGDIPVAALTGHEHEEEMRRLDEAGFKAKLRKPIDVKETIQTIERLSLRPPPIS